jgi:soluble lytic murein transglycosylase-like protein
MRFCSTWAGMLSLGAVVLSAAGPTHVRTVVRADQKTGRLVRAVAVSPRVVSAREVRSRVIGAAGKSGLEPHATLDEIIAETSRTYSVEPALVHSMVQVESNYNRYALSPKGAQGVMQLMPATARRFGVDNAFDARKNIEGGVRYLKYLQELYPHDLRRVLAAYNAGEGAVARYNGIPRYPETVNYIYQVGRRLGQNRAAGKNVNSVKRAGLDQKPPEHRPVEQFQDEEGRVYLRTR